MGHNPRSARRHKSPRFNVDYGQRQNQLSNYDTTVSAPGTMIPWEARLKNLEESIRPQLDANVAQYQKKMRAAFDRKYQA
ncbi:hypothetical protein SARC_11922, partial [Sphaeroforma arctica JP610]